MFVFFNRILCSNSTLNTILYLTIENATFMVRKRIKNLFVLVLVPAVSFMFQGCLDDETEYSQLTIGTVRVIEGNDYYFDIDDGTKMYPGDTTYISNYAVVEGQRAFIHFKLLDEKVPGYDYNAVIYRIEDILTKDVYIMPAEKEDSIGDDYIDVASLWFSGEFLNIQYQLYYDSGSDVKHMLNLVVNEASDGTGDKAGYLTVEFRHNAFGEPYTDLGNGLVSFNLRNIAEAAEGEKGLNIRVNTMFDGVLYRTIDFPAD